ncbi:MAG TPA: SCO family protein [Terracidiphilus sp.]|nr:SCO family protein [Terracidiphilus sp.]
MRCAVTIRRSWLNAAGAATTAIVLCVAYCMPAMALQSSTDSAERLSSYGNMRRSIDEKTTGPANKLPSILSGVGIAQHLNEQLPLNLTFTDDAGKQVELGDYFGKRPAILALVYYRCPMLCSEELDGLTSALEMVNFVPGKDFNIVIVSIDPSEGTDLAAAKKREYLKRYGHPETANGWHFLTGTQPNIDALTNAVGFRYVKLKVPGSNLTQFAHASAIQIVTPEGKLAQYYMGVEYSPKDLLLGLDEASSNKIGSPVDNILTYCYHYDPQTNTHSLIVARVVQLGGLLTLVLLGGFMTIMLRKDYRQTRQEATETALIETKVNG